MGIPLKVVLKPADANTKVQFVCSENIIAGFEINCLNANCIEIFSPQEFRFHLDTCAFREFSCEFYYEEMMFSESKLHLVRTPYF